MSRFEGNATPCKAQQFNCRETHCDVITSRV